MQWSLTPSQIDAPCAHSSFYELGPLYNFEWRTSTMSMYMRFRESACKALGRVMMTYGILVFVNETDFMLQFLLCEELSY